MRRTLSGPRSRTCTRRLQPTTRQMRGRPPPTQYTGARGRRPRPLPRRPGGPRSRTRTRRGRPGSRQLPGARLSSRSTGARALPPHLLPLLVCVSQLSLPSPLRQPVPHHCSLSAQCRWKGIVMPLGSCKPAPTLSLFPCALVLVHVGTCTTYLL